MLMPRVQIKQCGFSAIVRLARLPVDQLRAKWAEQDRAELPALPAAAEPLSVRR